MNIIYKELLFIDPSVPDVAVILSKLPEKVKAIPLHPGHDSVEQISQHLGFHRNIEALHIVTHGAPGELRFCDATLSTSTLNHYWDLLAGWSRFLCPDADILLYGCETGRGSTGRQFIRELASAIDCNIAASDGKVGYSVDGPQWRLDVTEGEVGTPVFIPLAAQDDWHHQLAATINSADLVVVSYNTDGDDTFALVALADIPGSSVIHITDEGYDDSGFIFNGSEDVFTWTVAAGGLSAGTIIRFTNASTTALALVDGSQGSLGQANGTFDMNLAAGDQLFIYQTADNLYDGTIERLDGSGGTEAGIIYGFNGDATTPSSSGWLDAGTAHTASSSQAPSNTVILTTSDGSGNASSANANGMLTQAALKGGLTAGEYDNYQYNGPTTATDKAGWLTRLHTTANWDASSIAAYHMMVDALASNWTVGSANTDPTISIANTTLAYTEGGSAAQIDSAATLSDSDGDTDWDGGTLEVQITANAEAGDEISIPDNIVGSINSSGTNLQNGATVIGTLSSSEGTVTNATKLTITFNSSATNTLVEQVLQAISVRNTSNEPGTSDRTITITATDKNGGTASDTRTVSVTDVTAASTTAAGFNTTAGTNLSPGITFGAGDETLTIADASHTSGSTADGGSGTDTLVAVDGVDLSSLASLSGFETLNVQASASVSMSSSQHNTFSTFTDNASQAITLVSGSDNVAGNANIENYTLGSSYSGTFTLGAAGQNVTGADSAADTVSVGMLITTGSFDGGTGTDVLEMSNGASISGATVTGFEILTLASGSSVSMTEAQHDNFSTVNGAGTEQITITAASDGLTGDADIETYVLGAANTFTLGAAGQNLTGSSGNDTVNVGALAITGTLNGSDGTADTLVLDNGADISGATISNFENLTVASGATVTLIASQLAQFSGTITAAGTETLNIIGDGNFTTLANIENVSVGDDSTNSRTVTLASAGTNVTAASATDAVTFDVGTLTYTGTLTGEGSVSDSIQLGNGANITGATLSNIDDLVVASGAAVSMTEEQHDAFSTVSGADTNQITISNAVDGLTGDADIETYVLGAANTFTLGAAGQNLTGSSGNDTVNVGALTVTGTLNGSGGTGDTLVLDNGADISGATVSNFENLTVASGATVTLSASQLAQFTGTITAPGTEDINITGNGNFTTLVNIENVSVGDDSTNSRTVTLASAGTNVTASSATDAVTFNVGTLTYTGTLTGEGTVDDAVQLGNGADITGATLSNIESLSLASDASVSMTVSQLAQFTGTVTAAGSEHIDLSGDGNFSTQANIESYSVSDSSTDTRTVTITQAGADVSATSATDAITFDVGTLALTGTLTGEGTVKDTLLVGNSGDLSGSTISGIENLSLASGASVTMTVAQANAFTGTITATGSETISLTTTGELTGTNLAGIEAFSTVSGGSETITMTATTASGKTLTAVDSANDAFVITGSSGDQTLNGSAGADTIDGGAGSDTIAGGAGADSLTGGADTDQFKGSASDLDGDTITDLASGETVLLTGVTGLSTSNVRFNGSATLEIDTNATTFASPEVSISLSNNAGATLAIASVVDSGSDTLITFEPSNTAPTLDDTQSPTLTAIIEDIADGSNTGTTVADLVVDNSISDADGSPVEAIAVSAVDTSNGSWQYKVGAGAWTAFDFASNSGKALLLDSTDSVRFVPNANWNGSVNSGLTFHAWDKASGSAGSYLTLSGNTGGSGPFSTDSDTAAVTVSAVNDAPTLAGLDNISVLAQGAAVALDTGSDASVSDVDSTDFDGGSLVISGNSSGGTFSLDGTNVSAGADSGSADGTLAASEKVFVGATEIGTVDGTNDGQGGNTLTLVLNSAATPTQIQTLLQNLKFSATSAGTVNLNVTLADGDGDTSVALTPSVTVRSAPAISNLNGDKVSGYKAGNGAVLLDKNGDATVSDADSSGYNTGTLTVSISSGGVDGEDVLAINDEGTGAGQIGVVGSDVSYGGNTIGSFSGGTNGNDLVITFNLTANDAAIGALLQNISYENTNTSPDKGARTFSFELEDSLGDTSQAASTSLSWYVPSSGGGSTGGTTTNDTIDGVPVSKTTDSAGNVTTTIPVVTADRTEDPNTSTSDADIPLINGDTNNNGNVVTATLPVGVGLSASGPGTAQTATDALTTLVRAIDARDNSDETNLIGGAQAFLNNLAATTTLDVRTIIPTTTSASLSSPIVITGTTASEGSTQSEAFVIDLRTLPSGSSLQLDNIEFASIMGSAVVTGGAGRNYVVGDDQAQYIVLGEDDDQLYGGAGDDTVGSEGGDDLLFGEAGNDTLFGGAGADTLHGGTDTDTVTYDGNLADYEVVQVNGVVTVTRKDDSSDSDTLVNVEQLSFADGSFTPVYGSELQAVATLYSQVLGRQADLGGFQWWTQDIANGLPLGGITLEFLRSAEYQANSGVDFDSLSSEDQLEQLYVAVLGRASDSDGKAFWLGELNNGSTIEQIAGAFVTSVELSGQYLQGEQWDFSL